MRQDRIDILLQPVNKFIKNETAGGIVLFAAAVLAIVTANSPLGDEYHEFWKHKFTIGFAGFEISKTLHQWINDGLMSVFFFVVHFTDRQTEKRAYRHEQTNGLYELG